MPGPPASPGRSGPGTSHDYWDSIAGAWDRDHPQQLWRAHSDAVNVGLCRRWFPRVPVRRMLKTDLFDEAFGAGLLERLTPGSAMSVGLDRSFQTSQAARRRLGRSEVCTSDVRQLPFASDVFDLVLSISTLDHFERAADISAALEELWRVTAPGGHLILTLDNAANPVVALRNRLPFSWTHRLGLVPYFVGATCGPRDGADRLRSAGFTVRDTTAVMHCPRVVGVLASRAAERLGGRAARAFLEMARRFEWLEGWPSRYRTGYFVSYLAEKTR